MGVMTNHIWPALGWQKWRATLGITLATAMVVAACSDDPTSPNDDSASLSCDADTGTVDVTVGASGVFDWSPACAVALLLVEDEASDMWGVSTDDATWNIPDQANLITPPLSYGAPQTGASQFQEPLPLLSGVTYELILWRVLPDGSAAQCQQRFENLCLLAVHPFVR